MKRSGNEVDVTAPAVPTARQGDFHAGGFFDPTFETPLSRLLHLALMRQELATRREERYAESLLMIRERQNVWQGTTAEVTRLPDVRMIERLSVHRFVRLFTGDPQAPEVRKQHFAEFFQPDSKDRCVGWRICLRSAEVVDDGWLVDVEVGVHLIGETQQFTVSDGSTNEVWHVSRNGKLTFVKGTPGRPAPVYVRL